MKASEMTREQRRARIVELENELANLRQLELRDLNASDQDLATMCKDLMEAGAPAQAVKLYRLRTGCGLKEAYDAIRAMK